MTFEIGLVLAILVAALVLLVTEAVRMDIVALLVLCTLAITGLVDPAQALSGFGNPAVVTVWAMFILSAALTRTGVAALIGERVLRWAGTSELRLVTVVMLVSGVLSAFMNNIGVAAFMLPVVLDVARRRNLSPSRLLMPLAYGCLLGGLTTLIGTPPNLLVSEALAERGLRRFTLFDFTPVGAAVMLAGIAFVALVGRRLLPARDPARDSPPIDTAGLTEQYALTEQSLAIRIPEGSPLVGRTLQESRLGSATGINVYAIVRGGKTRPLPTADSTLRAGDRLLAEGSVDRLEELRAWRELVVEKPEVDLERLVSREIGLAELLLPAESEVVGRTLGRVNFRERFGVMVLAIGRDGEVIRRDLVDRRLRAGDRLLVQGHREQFAALGAAAEFETCNPVGEDELAGRYRMRGYVFSVRVPAGSVLDGKTLAESHLGEALGLGVFGVIRGQGRFLMPGPELQMLAEDRLLVRGSSEDLKVFSALQQLEIVERKHHVKTSDFGASDLVEAVLAPRSSLAGRKLRELEFRERYGMHVLAILRNGRVLRSDMRNETVEHGDALLMLGPPVKRELLARDPDVIVLSVAAGEAPRRDKAPVASIVMLAVLVPVLAGWVPIAIAAVAGAALMVLGGCLSMEQAYRSIQWRAVFLIAGLLPLGTALYRTGAAELIAEGLLAVTGSWGHWGVVVSLYVVTSVATCIIPTAALVVLMAPIAFSASSSMGLSPHAAMMAVAIAASASFTSPVSHPANLLVMGPGGYRFADYLKLGMPLTLVVMLVTMLLLPFFWPF